MLILLLIVLALNPVDDLARWLATPRDQRPAISTEPFATRPLSAAEAKAATDLLLADRTASLRSERAQEWKSKSITLDGRTMKFGLRVLGDKPAAGRSLFISMHGGGNTKPEVNEQQWRNQIRLYEPSEGVYLAPRAPTDTWNLWHEGHIDTFLDRIIENAVLLEDVNPDRVYLMGYSAGGDGVYQLAPRMADRFAAASMMAGHPNEASPLGLRNLPFAIHVGENDSGYGRNDVARRWGEQLDSLRAADPDGYEHITKLHAGRGHWMNREDAEAVPWMASFTRNALPRRVVWRQDDVTHARFYWLAVDQPRPGSLVIASVDGQTVQIEKTEHLTDVSILLCDAMLNLDLPVVVKVGPKTVFEGAVPRTIEHLSSSVQSRLDARLVFSARITVTVPPP